MTATARSDIGRPRPAPTTLAGPSLAGMYALRVSAIWNFFRKQSLSFWMVCGYMVIEYVRPQAIYPALTAVPWAQLLILGTPLVYVLEGGGLRARNPINLWMVVFSGAVLLSWFFAVDPALAQADMYIYVNWVLAYILVANLVHTEGRFFVFYLLFLLASFKMSQHGLRTWAVRGFGFANWGATGAPGWFHNSGEFGIQMCVFLPLSIYFIVGLRPYLSKWKLAFLVAFPVTAVASIVATNSRGALLGAAGVGLWILLRTRYRVRALVGLALAAVIVVQIMPAETRERFTTMGTDETSMNRRIYWSDGIEVYKNHPVTGIGYANWSEYYRQNYGRSTLPHNIFIQAASELGSVGLIALLGLIVASFVVTARTRRVAKELGESGRFIAATARGMDGAMIGYLVSGFFVTVLYYPYLWFALGMTSALHAAALSLARKVKAGVMTASAARPAMVPGWRSIASGVVTQHPVSHQLPRLPGTR